MDELERFPNTADVEAILAAFDRDGGVIIEQLYPVDVISEMAADAQEYASGVVPGSATQGFGEVGRSFAGTNTVRFSSLGKVSPAFFKMLDNPLHATLADAVLKDCPGHYWVNTGQVMYIGPGEPAQVLHRDANNWWEYLKATWPDTPEVTVSVMVGLDQVTEEMGATRVVPGSHRWADLDRFSNELPSVAAELGPGDALLYSGFVLHGGGANTTADRWRRAMHLSFVAGWLTPEEASAIDYTTDELKDQSPRVQRLLGHRSYNPAPAPGGGLWLEHVRAIGGHE